jgi:hypothetical protein
MAISTAESASKGIVALIIISTLVLLPCVISLRRFFTLKLVVTLIIGIIIRGLRLLLGWWLIALFLFFLIGVLIPIIVLALMLVLVLVI